jgi:hypothetical protein
VAGDAYCPLLIAPNRGAQKIFDTGIPRDIDILMEIREPAYAAAEIFRRYIETVFFPVIAANRKLPGCRNKPAILFCDSCARRCSEDVLAEFARHGVLAPSYPPHTSNLFQVLDLLLVGRLKSAKKYLPRNDQASALIDHIIRTFKACETVTINTMVRAVGRKQGLSMPRWAKPSIYWSMMGKSENQLTF